MATVSLTAKTNKSSLKIESSQKAFQMSLPGGGGYSGASAEVETNCLSDVTTSFSSSAPLFIIGAVVFALRKKQKDQQTQNNFWAVGVSFLALGGYDIILGLISALHGLVTQKVNEIDGVLQRVTKIFSKFFSASCTATHFFIVGGIFHKKYQQQTTPQDQRNYLYASIILFAVGGLIIINSLFWYTFLPSPTQFEQMRKYFLGIQTPKKKSNKDKTNKVTNSTRQQNLNNSVKREFKAAVYGVILLVISVTYASQSSSYFFLIGGYYFGLHTQQITGQAQSNYRKVGISFIAFGSFFFAFMLFYAICDFFNLLCFKQRQYDDVQQEDKNEQGGENTISFEYNANV